MGCSLPGSRLGNLESTLWRLSFPPAYSAEQEREALQNQVKFFEDQLTALRERIEELEGETGKKK